MSYAIRIEGLERVQRILGTDFGPVMATAAESIGEEIRDKLAPAPGPVHKPIIWASEKQRRFYFANRKGLGPYVRESDPQSQRMIQGWTIDKKTGGAVLKNKATYAPFVHSAELQQPMHKATGWVTDKEAIETVVDSGAVQRIILQAIRGALRR